MLVCDSRTDSAQRTDFIAKWNPDEVFKTTLGKPVKVRTLWWWKTFWSFGLAQWPQTQRAVLFCRSFSLVAEINLGEKLGGQACSRGKSNRNTREELLAPNLPIFTTLNHRTLLCYFRWLDSTAVWKHTPRGKTRHGGRLTPSFLAGCTEVNGVGCKEHEIWSQTDLHMSPGCPQ